ncbi:MAG: nodulation protein NfeD [Desulfobacterales bacterium]|nr:MAG: nodulation protein NfeD [Desulfobacterales bacterium]
MKRLRDLYKTSPFAQSLRQTQMFALKIREVLLRQKSSPFLTLDKMERFVKVSHRSALAGVVLAGLLLGTFPMAAQAAKGEVYVVEVSGTINPGLAEYVIRSIEKANGEQAACLVMQLDTPGGLALSMRSIVMAVLASEIPVVVYVSPSGARAASAGVMITLAADIAAMAPGTNIGAAHPVNLGQKEMDKAMAEKVVNDMVAYTKSISEKRGRNSEWAEKAVRESVSATETEALNLKVIDLIAEDLDDLIEKIDGRDLKDKGTLVTKGLNRVILTESLRDKILKTLSDPNIAYLLMMIGMAGLYFELSHPGAIFPGVIGAISLILAFFAFQTLPVNYAGILLIALALILFILEMKVTSYGLLSLGGVISLFLGSLMLFEGTAPEMRLSWRVLIPTVVMVSGFFVVVAGLVFRSQISKPRTGDKGLVGEVGVVKERLGPEGKVFVHGELWNAEASEPIEAGAKVRVIGVDQLVLKVEEVK